MWRPFSTRCITSTTRSKTTSCAARQALPPGGLFLTRVGDAAAGLPYRLCIALDQAVIFARGHRLPRLYGRTLAEWIAALEALRFQVAPVPMSEGKPFANVMLVCRLAAR